MSFKKNWNGIPKSLISQYKPNYGYQQGLVQRNSYLDPQKVNNMLRN
jgi:hypothetical protein